MCKGMLAVFIFFYPWKTSGFWKTLLKDHIYLWHQLIFQWPNLNHRTCILLSPSAFYKLFSLLDFLMTMCLVSLPFSSPLLWSLHKFFLDPVGNLPTWSPSVVHSSLPFFAGLSCIITRLISPKHKLNHVIFIWNYHHPATNTHTLDIEWYLNPSSQLKGPVEPLFFTSSPLLFPPGTPYYSNLL